MPSSPGAPASVAAAATPSPARRDLLLPWLPLAALGAVLTLLALGWLAATRLGALAEADQQETRTRQVLLALEHFSAVLLNAESAQRGYVVTGDERHLQDYDRCVRDARTEFTALLTLTAGAPTQQAVLAGLEAELQAKLAGMDRNVQLRRTQGFEAGRASVEEVWGQGHMARIHRVLAFAQAEEQRLLALHAARKSAQATRTVRALAVGGAVSVLTLLAVVLMLGREAVRRRTSEAALAAHRDRLEELVAQRTDALQQSRQDLSRLAQHLMEQEQATTRRLAQLLHDGLGQTLSALRLQLAALDMGAALQSLTPPQRRHAQAVQELVNRAAAEVRGALVELRPALLEEQGLVAALDDKLRLRRRDTPGIVLELQVAPGLEQLRWPPEVEHAFFMVAREALDNAVQHAGAGYIRCAVEGAPRWLRLQVQDDGRGVPDDPRRPGHLGVVGMRERALAIGARFRLKGRPGQGTRMELEWESDADDPDLPGG